MRKILFCILFLTSFSEAIVLDWSGSYKLEEEFIQDIDLGEWQFHILHNLRLEPNIKVLDGLSIISGFQLAPPSDFYAEHPDNIFYYQNGASFGWNNAKTNTSAMSVHPPTSLETRHLYLNFTHNFGIFEMGWKPHHFGMGMYYNDGSQVFSPVYNKQGSQGFISWKGFFGSSYYVQPIVHFINNLLFNVFIQGGIEKDPYGVEAIYKMPALGLDSDLEKTKWSSKLENYFGIYAYYKATNLLVEVEGGQMGSTRGGALKIKWNTPWKKLNTNLDLGFSSKDQDKVFYFDPSFSSTLSFMIERHEGFKNPSPEYLKQYLSYAFHSAFYTMPSFVFSVLNSLDLEARLFAHFAYPDWNTLLCGSDLIVSYKIPAGVQWITRLGILFPNENNWHIGVNSGVAITF